MSRGVILRHNGSFGSFGGVHRREICCLFSIDVLFLCGRGVFSCISLRMFKLRCEHFPVLYWVNILLFVFCRILLRNDWAICGYGMSCGILLRDHWSYCSDGDLCDREIFKRFVFCMYQLLGRYLSGLDGFFCLHGMSRGVLLRYRWPHGSDGCVHRGYIRFHFFEYVHRLPRGYFRRYRRVI